MYTKFGQFIDGKWQQSSSGETYDVINPATEEVIGKASKANSNDVQRALKSAEKGLQIWRNTSPWERSKIIRKISDLMRQRVDILSKWLTLEVGKPLTEGPGEVGGAADIFEWNSEETKRIFGEINQSRFPNTRIHVIYQPVGVVAALVPWNFPVILASRKISTALAAGCSVIVKPDVITPGSVTRVNTSLRSVSGTSANGTEVSFIDQGYEPIALNNAAFLPTPRLVASRINEVNKLGNLPKQKSLTMDVNMNSPDPNLSPVLDVKNATFILGRNKINNPVGFDNYATDSRTNQIEDDPHGSIFVSNRINLKQPATSLKVMVTSVFSSKSFALDFPILKICPPAPPPPEPDMRRMIKIQTITITMIGRKLKITSKNLFSIVTKS